MLLNEFLQEHETVETENTIITQLKTIVARQEATIREQQKRFA